MSLGWYFLLMYTLHEIMHSMNKIKIVPNCFALQTMFEGEVGGGGVILKISLYFS